jgi:hypothetical protein
MLRKEAKSLTKIVKEHTQQKLFQEYLTKAGNQP